MYFTFNLFLILSLFFCNKCVVDYRYQSERVPIMKKKISIMLVLTMISGVAGCNFTSAADNSDVVISQTVEGSEEPVSVRNVFESIGYDVNWESTSKTIWASKNKNVVSITLNSDIATLNGENIKMNKAAELSENSMCITVAAASALTGEQVNSDGSVTLADDSSDDSWKKNKVDVDLNSVDGDKYEITDEGVYTLSGNYSGMVYVNCEGKVTLVLNGVTINNENGPAVFFENSKKGIIELADGTVNTLSDGTEYNVDAKGTVFSNDDIELQGSGTLNITANYNHALKSDDDIEIKECTLNITTNVGDGINANDAIKIKSRKITLNVKGDGINGGKCVVIDDGDVNITTTGEITESNEDLFGGGRPPRMNGENNQPPEMANDVNNGDNQPPEMANGVNNGDNQPPEMPNGVNNGDNQSPEMPKFDNENAQDDDIQRNRESDQNMENVQSTDETDEKNSDESSKGIKSDLNVTINGGNIGINSTDHGIKCDGIVVINNGDINITSQKSKGIKAVGNMFINDGDIDIDTRDECLESKATVTINGGTVDIKSEDDGINAGGGEGASMMGHVSDGDEHQIVFNGGKVTVNANGDGLDSNGNLYFYGGEIVVYGPESNGDGALDSAANNTYFGGTLAAIGSSGMAEVPEAADGKSVLSFTLDSVQDGNSSITIMDGANNTIFSTIEPKSFQSVVFACDDIVAGEEYSLYINGEKTASLTAVDGVARYGNSTFGGNGDRGFGDRQNRENRNFGGFRGNADTDNLQNDKIN